MPQHTESQVTQKVWVGEEVPLPTEVIGIFCKIHKKRNFRVFLGGLHKQDSGRLTVTLNLVIEEHACLPLAYVLDDSLEELHINEETTIVGISSRNHLNCLEIVMPPAIKPR